MALGLEQPVSEGKMFNYKKRSSVKYKKKFRPLRGRGFYYRADILIGDKGAKFEFRSPNNTLALAEAKKRIQDKNKFEARLWHRTSLFKLSLSDANNLIPVWTYSDGLSGHYI